MLDDCNRQRQFEKLESDGQPFDIVVIGGGATGVGVAVDAAARGYRVVVLEQHDFGKGTSSRSTKLIHGGVRYLQQGRIGLVREALRERGMLCRNASHLVRPLPTIVPVFGRWETFYYGLGLKMYDWLSGSWSLGRSRVLSLAETLAAIPTLEQRGLRGSILYLDAFSDDARLLVNLVQTAIDHGGVCLNYTPVRELIKENGRVTGVVAEDLETGKSLRVAGRVVVNAAGPFSDEVQQLDDRQTPPAIAPSQGVHLVFDRELLSGDTAMVVPRTRDGRVVFAVPWHGHVLVGTTDTPLEHAPLEPHALPEEIEFLLETVGPYLARPPQRGDVRSVFAGVRPLVHTGKSQKTSQIGREHVIRVSPSGLVSIMGGKWTSYRKMGEDCVDRAAAVGDLPPQPCRTKELLIHGTAAGSKEQGAGSRESEASAPPSPHPDSRIPHAWLSDYGTDGPAIEQLVATNSAWGKLLDERLPYVVGQVVWAARYEMARSVEDVLARRTRSLFLNSEAALAVAPRVAQLLADELGRDSQWQADQLQQFQDVAQAFLCGHG